MRLLSRGEEGWWAGPDFDQDIAYVLIFSQTSATCKLQIRDGSSGSGSTWEHRISQTRKGSERNK